MKKIRLKTIRQKPVRFAFSMVDRKKVSYWATRPEFPVIELKGEPIESFDRVSKIKEVILLGADDEVRRIIIK